jgi:hypothetical protein
LLAAFIKKSKRPRSILDSGNDGVTNFGICFFTNPLSAGRESFLEQQDV